MIKKKTIYDYIKYRLSTDEKWQLKALTAIYARQTGEEQRLGQTVVYNNIGFTGCDAEILTSFAKQYKVRQWLSPKQMQILAKKMKKYWHQIYEISDKHTLAVQAAVWSNIPVDAVQTPVVEKPIQTTLWDNYDEGEE